MSDCAGESYYLFSNRLRRRFVVDKSTNEPFFKFRGPTPHSPLCSSTVLQIWQYGIKYKPITNDFHINLPPSFYMMATLLHTLWSVP